MAVPGQAADVFAQAEQAHRAGQVEQAAALYRAVLAAAPAHAEAHHRLGLLLSGQGRPAEALAHLEQAVHLDGRNPFYRHNLGEAYRRQGDLGRAEAAFRQAVQQAPGFAEAYYSLANVVKALGRLDEAEAYYREAVRLKPGHTGAHYNLGNTLLERGRFHAAAACYEAVLRLDPAHAAAHNNRGAALKELDQVDAALAHFDAALRLPPGFDDALRNRGLVYEKQGRTGEARAAYTRLLARTPPDDAFCLHVDTLCPVVFESNDEIDRYRAGLAATLARYRSAPFRPDATRLHLSGGAPPAQLPYQGRDDRPLKQAWAALYAGAFPEAAPRRSGGKPHVGFVVTHGHEGVFLKCMRGLLQHLPEDRLRLTVVCSRQGGASILAPAIARLAVQYLPLPARLDEAAAAVRDARFDVLYYWEVGTDVTNYVLPFFRPAPVQCTSWGWPVTSGIPQMDFFLSSVDLEAGEADAHYTEQLVRLAHLPLYYYRPPVPARPYGRTHFGLPEDVPLYLCAQNLRKVHPDFDALAAGILRGDGRGLLVFIEDARPHVTALLRRRHQAAMPDVAARIRFLPRMAEAEYLSLTARADVVLDTVHYGGGANTTYDAFAAGTPVVTLPARFHRGRYAAAAYRRIGLPEAVAASPEAYVETALRLAVDRAERDALRRRITEACPVLFEDRQAVAELADFFEAAPAAAR